MLSSYTKLFDVLSLELKVELLAKLTDSIKNDVSEQSFVDKKKLGRELYGFWAGVDDNIIDVIYSSRTISDRVINLED